MIRPGDRIGHIRIDSHLAEGGMGEVFVGFDERLERQVALKVVHSENLDARSRTRFLAEARILSQLEHPNVCRIHGYLESDEEDVLVLELIRGRTLRQALREGLDPRAKLGIAENLAGALAAAHEKGIVHRDLKLDNVMLTEEGEVKVLDFGLARLEGPGSGRDVPPSPLPPRNGIDGGAGEAPPWPAPPPPAPPAPPAPLAGVAHWVPSLLLRTRQGLAVGTPSCMSPEQARGEPATAASDVYSLGLLLQELFTGRPPYEPGLSALLLLVKAGDGDIAPLEGMRDPDLAALVRRLEALAPEARPTAAEAAERLAWIRARPQRRRRRLVAAAVAAAFVLGGLEYTLDLRRERQLAVAARDEARQEAARGDAVARFLEELFQAAGPRQARGALPDARELLRRGTERLGRELRGQPLLRARLLDALGGIDVELGLFDQARPLLAEALAIRERLRGPGHLEVAETLVHLGSLAQLSGRGDAVTLFRRALGIRLARLGPDHAEVADLLGKLGTALAAQGRFAPGEATLRRALALDERLFGDRDPRVAKVLHNLSGIAYYRGRIAEAEGLLRRALAIREAALPEDDPDLAGSREALALLLQRQGKAAAAAALLERLPATTERVYGPEHPELAKTLLNLGLARADLGQDAAARPLLERAVAINEKALEPDHPQLLQALTCLAGLDRRQGRAAEAAALDRRALAATRRRLAADPGNPGERQRLAQTLVDLGRAYHDLGQPARAEESWREAVTMLTPPSAGPANPDGLAIQARALLYLGRTEEARPLVKTLLAQGPPDPELLELARERGLAPR